MPGNPSTFQMTRLLEGPGRSESAGARTRGGGVAATTRTAAKRGRGAARRAATPRRWSWLVDQRRGFVHGVGAHVWIGRVSSWRDGGAGEGGCAVRAGGGRGGLEPRAPHQRVGMACQGLSRTLRPVCGARLWLARARAGLIDSLRAPRVSRAEPRAVLMAKAKAKPAAKTTAKAKKPTAKAATAPAKSGKVVTVEACKS